MHTSIRLGARRALNSFSFSSDGVRGFTPVLLAVIALSFLAYGSALLLPLIADDYQQIQYARDFAPPSGWSALAQDALYRCRATSLLLTYWTESLFGWNVFAFNLSSLLLHIVNAMLVWGLGAWRLVGWRVAALGACVFAVFRKHSEAVVWYSALPELLVFTFVLASFLCWIHWIQGPGRNRIAYAASFALFILALFSKESAVALVGLQVLSILLASPRPWRRLWAVVPFALLATVYFALTFLERKTHLHFNDGTFALGPHFLPVMLRSAFRLLWISELAALVVLLVSTSNRWRTFLIATSAWIAIVLLPYSFLTYMPFVPSRHNYLAAAAASLILGAAFVELWERRLRQVPKWGVLALAALFLAHQCVDLWTRKHHQYRMRAEPTEQLYRHALATKDVLYVRCFPYWEGIGDLVLRHRIAEKDRPRLVVGGLAMQQAGAVDLCNDVTGRGRFGE